jgi:hypothetical protein
VQHRAFHPWWWVATAAIVFFALWAWRELGIRVAVERNASGEAEVRFATHVINRLTTQLGKIDSELANVTSVYPVGGLEKGSARVFVDAQGHGLVVVSGAARGTYDLRDSAQMIGTVDVPASGQKTVLLDKLPPPPAGFTLSRR